MFLGAACRLAFDIGLNLDCSALDFPERELQIRHMVLWACIIYDQYWALFLGRPTTIKTSDLAISQRSEHCQRFGECRPSGPEKKLETLIYEALLDLMDLTGKITERVASGNPPLNRNAYLCMAAQDLDLNTWYMRLPEPLQWNPGNVATAPFSFFVLQ